MVWSKVLNPLRKAGGKIEEAVPLMVELVAVFHDWPEAFKVLNEMASQFKTDSGSSLRDVVNNLTVAAEANAAAVAEGVRNTREQQVKTEAAAQLAVRDREQLIRLLLETDRIATKLDIGLAAIAAIQSTATNVASNLATAQVAVDGVATDLAQDRVTIQGVATDLATAQAAGEATRRSADEERLKVARNLATAQLVVDDVAAELARNTERLAAARAEVARNLLAAQAAVDAVATDLEAAHQRADDAPSGTAGEAADAASRSAESRAWLDGVNRDRRGHDPDATRAWEESGAPDRRGE